MEAEPLRPTPTALVSWAHDSDAGRQFDAGPDRSAADEAWLKQVLDLVTHLRVVGDVDADIDIVHGAEAVDWSRWGPEKVRSSDFVIVPINHAWARRFSGEEAHNRGAGATAEADELLGLFERSRDEFDRKLIIVLLPGVDASAIPARLRGRVTRIVVPAIDEDGLENLLRRIYGRNKYELAPLRGSTPPLPPTNNDLSSGPAQTPGSSGEDRATGPGVRSEPSRHDRQQQIDESHEDIQTRLAAVESALRALPPGSANEEPILPLGRQWRLLSSERTRLKKKLSERAAGNDDDYRTVRFMWVEEGKSLRGYQGDVSSEVLSAGRIVPDGFTKFPGPNGAYNLIPEEHWRTIGTTDAAPIFLHEAFASHLEKWVRPIGAGGSEASAAIEARDFVIQMVDSRLAANPDVLTVSSTITSMEQTRHGWSVTGRAVIIAPVEPNRS